MAQWQLRAAGSTEVCKFINRSDPATLFLSSTVYSSVGLTLLLDTPE